MSRKPCGGFRGGKNKAPELTGFKKCQSQKAPTGRTLETETKQNFRKCPAGPFSQNRKSHLNVSNPATLT